MQTVIKSAIEMLENAYKDTDMKTTKVYISCALSVLKKSISVETVQPKIGIKERKVTMEEPKQGDFTMDINQQKQIISIKDIKGNELADTRKIKIDDISTNYKKAKGQTIKRTCKVLD